MNEDQSNKLSEIYNNPSAAKLALDLCAVLEFWDRTAVDGRSSIPAINQSLWTAMVDLPRNEFYRANFDTLHPLVTSTILDWMAAMQIEMQTKPSMAEMERAYNCRQSYISILVMIAACAAGPAYAATAGPVIRSAFDDGGLKAYISAWKKRPALPAAEGAP